tara:strand:+ start:198 stop:458 length:261 start_codon:yes stop_codon:yes gene_type:complete
MEHKLELNEGNLILDVIVTQEKIDDKTFFVAQGIQIDVASQGLSLEEALENIKDAAEIVIENSKDTKENIQFFEKQKAPILTRVSL